MLSRNVSMKSLKSTASVESMTATVEEETATVRPGSAVISESGKKGKSGEQPYIYMPILARSNTYKMIPIVENLHKIFHFHNINNEC